MAKPNKTDREYLTEDEVTEMIADATGKTPEEVEEAVAAFEIEDPEDAEIVRNNG